MSKRLYWEDVQEGQDIPALEKKPTTQQLAMYAGASLDFNPIHYDKEKALADGLPGVILHGALKNAWLAQLLTDWVGPDGALRKLSVQYRGMDVPDDTLTIRGKASRTYVEGGRHFVDCEVWLENGKGEKTTPGTATVVLPSREAP